MWLSCQNAFVFVFFFSVVDRHCKVLASAEETDYAALDALEAKVVFYRQLVLAAVRGELPTDMRDEIERIREGR